MSDKPFFGLTEDETRIMDTIITKFIGEFSMDNQADQDTLSFLAIRLEVVQASMGWKTVELPPILPDELAAPWENIPWSFSFPGLGK
jgi:hypothetical protein